LTVPFSSYILLSVANEDIVPANRKNKFFYDKSSLFSKNEPKRCLYRWLQEAKQKPLIFLSKPKLRQKDERLSRGTTFVALIFSNDGLKKSVSKTD